MRIAILALTLSACTHAQPCPTVPPVVQACSLPPRPPWSAFAVYAGPGGGVCETRENAAIRNADEAALKDWRDQVSPLAADAGR